MRRSTEDTRGTRKSVPAKGRPSAKVGSRRATVKNMRGRKVAPGVMLLGGSAQPYRKVKALLSYDPSKGVGPFVAQIRNATPMQLVDVERKGVGGRLLKDIAAEMRIPTMRFFKIIGVPRATAEKKASTNSVVAGAGGQAALAMARLLGIAESIASNSTAPEARGFNAAEWLGKWIERPQPALGGKKPADLLDTPTGIEVVSRLLGAIESGAYL